MIAAQRADCEAALPTSALDISGLSYPSSRPNFPNDHVMILSFSQTHPTSISITSLSPRKMAEAIGLVASIFAVVQLADRITVACKYYLETVDGCPKDLRLIFVELGSLKAIFDGLTFLDKDDPDDSKLLISLQGVDGPIEGCRRAMNELEKQFPTASSSSPSSSGIKTKKQKLNATLTSLAWPLKASISRRLMQEIMQHKSTITVALQGQLL